MAGRRGVGGWGSRPVWPNDQQILCVFSRCNAHHALVLSAAAKRPWLRLKFLQRSVCTRNSGLNTQVIFWACAPWRLRIQPSKIHVILSRQTDRRRRDKKAFCFSASARAPVQRFVQSATRG